MGQHLVIDEFVALADLHDAVERHHPAPLRGLVDHKVLVLGCLAKDYGFDFDAQLKADTKRFVEPGPVASGRTTRIRQATTPRRVSFTVADFALNADLRMGNALCGLHEPHMKTSRAA